MDRERFSEYENQPFPPSLSEYGNLRPARQKSGIIKYIEAHQTVNGSPAVSTTVLDGDAINNMLSTREGRTFANYAHNILLPFVETHVKNANRLDIVWDRYFPNSLKIAQGYP